MSVILFFLTLYVVFLIACVYAWNKKEYDMVSGHPLAGLSVVVCARNEEKNIGTLLTGIFSQEYTAREVIVVDDGSTDGTAEIVRSFPEARLITTNGVGKKAALKQGIDAATQDIIVCTDADCCVTPTWLGSVAACFDRYNPSLLIMPVSMNAGNSVWQQLQALEFISLAAVTAGSAAMDRPVMCNGANLAFRRDIWRNAFEDIHANEPSGDDMFFLISCKKKKEPVYYLKSREAKVAIEPCATWQEFGRQRKRWVSKGKSYADIEIVLVALITFVVTCAPLALAAIWLWKDALIVWGVKTIADGWFLSHFASFFQTKISIRHVVLLALVYPFYVGYVVIAGVFGRVRWK